MRAGYLLSGLVVLRSGGALAQTAPGSVDPGVTSPAAAISLLPVGASDADSAPPPAVAWGTWLYPARYPGGAPMSGPQTPMFTRLKLELPPLLGFRPFLSTILDTNLSNPLSKASAGLTFDEGPLRLGTRLSHSRDRSQVLVLNNRFATATVFGKF